MKRKRGMAIHEHRKAGREIAVMRDRLLKLSCIFDGKYPKGTARLMDRAIRLLDEFRSKMDDIACKEWHGVLGHDFIKLYYPPQEDRKL